MHEDFVKVGGGSLKGKRAHGKNIRRRWQTPVKLIRVKMEQTDLRRTLQDVLNVGGDYLRLCNR